MTERKEAATGGTATAAQPDEWRHVRAVLAKRTPDSTLVVNRYAIGVCPDAGGKATTVMMRKQDDPNEAQVDRDLDALSILWNAADEMLTALDRERERVAAISAVLNAPMWEPNDETDDTICRCDWCLAETARLAATYQCRDCGYQGQPMAWGCLDPENVERMSRDCGENYSLGDVICPICGGGQGFESDPWATLRAIRTALAADVPGRPGEGGQGQ